VRPRHPSGWYLKDARLRARSHLSCAGGCRGHCRAAVKVHGVLPSSRGCSASSRSLQFHGIPSGDSGAVVTPFVQVGTYPTRNFATLGPLELRPPFTGPAIPGEASGRNRPARNPSCEASSTGQVSDPIPTPEEVAESCVFTKQSLPPMLCRGAAHPKASRAAPLLPKLRGQFAEFLHWGCFHRLSALRACSPVSVWGTVRGRGGAPMGAPPPDPPRLFPGRRPPRPPASLPGGPSGLPRQRGASPGPSAFARVGGTDSLCAESRGAETLEPSAIPDPTGLVVTHVSIRTSDTSSGPRDPPSSAHGTFRYRSTLGVELAASVRPWSPGTFSAGAPSTSALLRVPPRMAASKPTSWLSSGAPLLSHWWAASGP